jgi:ferritin
MIRLSYEKEKTNTIRIHNIYKLAEKYEEYQTMTFLDWFIKEQTEEENKFREILKKFELLKNIPQRTFLINETLIK